MKRLILVIIFLHTGLCFASPRNLKWRYQTNSKVISSPFAGIGFVFVGSNDGYIYAFIDPGEEDFVEKQTFKKLPKQTKLSCLPNPFTSRLTITAPCACTVYDLTGRIVAKLDKGKHSVSTDTWQAGVYIVKSGRGTKRIVKIQ